MSFLSLIDKQLRITDQRQTEFVSANKSKITNYKNISKNFRASMLVMGVDWFSEELELKDLLKKVSKSAHHMFEKELKIKLPLPFLNNFNINTILIFFGYCPDKKRAFELSSILLSTLVVDLVDYNRLIKEKNKSLNAELLLSSQTIRDLNISASQYAKQYAGKKMTAPIYQELIGVKQAQNYRSRRLRVMIFILALTGIQIQQLRSLKFYQLEPVLNSSYHHLTTEGQRVWENREKDFEYLFSDKDSNSYCFTAKSRPKRPLARESITRDINKVLKNVSQKHLEGSKLTSYSFRTGYINQLWKTPEGLKLVKELLTSTEPKTAKSIKEKY